LSLLSLLAVGGPPHPDAKSACAAMNQSMLIEVMHGFGEIAGYSRNSGCGYECGRKTFRWDNGPQGFGDGSPAGKSTQWPSTLNMAASFDPVLAGEWGDAMGDEFWSKGTNIQEGPGINIARIENNGRTFEYLSGEDPVLGGTLVTPLIDGIQKHVMAISKHYILNNQETDRSGVNEIVDEKTIMELYLPPFGKAAANSAGYMCAYNRINGVWACENPETVKTMLKGYYNFSGFVVSDWGACHSTVASINAGLDIEMPNGDHYNDEAIGAAITNGSVTVDQLRDSCNRIMSGWYNLPVDKRYPCDGGNCIQNNVSTPEHKALARKVSAQSTVLIKNAGGLLPLDATKKLKIVLIGHDATSPYVSGQGSGGVPTSNMLVSPLAAFQARGADVTYEPATTVAAAVAAAKAADVAIVFGSAHSGEGHDRKNLYFDGHDAVQYKTTHSQDANNCSTLVNGIIGSGFFKSKKNTNVGDCCKACWHESNCIAFTVNSGTCFLKDNADPEENKTGRVSGIIPGRHPNPHPHPPSPPSPSGAQIEDVIVAVGAVNKNTIVSAVVPGQILTDWRDSAAAILVPFLPGEQYGNAIADIIYGSVIPQAKLPLSFPNHANEQNMSVHQYPGVPTAEYKYQATYSEGQINGYRWYDKHNVKPAFPFGHGLTYGGMTYSNLATTGRTISFEVQGTGCDTPQLYIGYPSAATDPKVPKKVMRYFQKVCATATNANAASTITYTLTDRDVSNWNVATKKWSVTSGNYAVYVGSSSQDIRLTGSLTI